jgi:RNA polymerase-binding transcription factor DksA
VRALLEQEQAARAREVNLRAARCGSTGRAPDGAAGDEGDKALLSLQEQLEHVELVRVASTLWSIEAALKTLDHGCYGICLGCGRPIPARRLRAVPTAIRCRECQESAEAERVARAAWAPARSPKEHAPLTSA